jgi:hypothetical protein
MHNILKLIIILSILILPACTEDKLPAEAPAPSVAELESMVIANCYILQDALETFKADNDGICPLDIYNDTNDEGVTVIDLLPDGQLLENPFTGLRTEPVDTIATEPGQVGYFQGHAYSWGSPLYYINGYGEHYTIIELSNLDELEQAVISNCMLVREAAETFAALNGGIYPGNVDADMTPGGDTLIDLLPGGALLRNPFTVCNTEPINCAASNPGETGYVPIYIGGANMGYTITGCARHAGVTTFTCYQTPSDSCLVIGGVTIYCTE